MNAVQLGVLAAAGHQLFVRPKLDQTRAVEDDDQVGHPHRAEAVRDEHRDPADRGVVPAVRRRLRDFHGYVRAAADVLMKGRKLRGRAARRTRAAIGHAVAFGTWSSLTQEQELTHDEAVALMSTLVESARR